MDLKSYGRWYDYSRARDDMFKATDTPWATRNVVRSDDERRARLNVISHQCRKFRTRSCRGTSPTYQSAGKLTATSNPIILTSSSPNSIGERRGYRWASVVVCAHESVVNRGRLIKPMTCEAVRGLAARGATVRIESELVVPHRHYVTLPALSLDGRVRPLLRGRWKR